MLCYVMLCYVMLCYVMLCYVMLCYVMLCYVMLHPHFDIYRLGAVHLARVWQIVKGNQKGNIKCYACERANTKQPF